MTLYATNRFPGDGATTTYEINFVGKYIDRSHVKAYVEDDVTFVRTPVAIADAQWLNDTTIQGFAPTPTGKTLIIRRETPKAPLVEFVTGARFTSYNLDIVATQGVFLAAEAMDAAFGAEETAVAAAAQALASALAASASASLAAAHNLSAAGYASAAATSAGDAADTLVVAIAAKDDSQNYATDAAASAAAASATALALAGGSIGFDASAYDFGYVADPSTYFNRDFGSIV